MFGLGLSEILVILALGLLIFGPTKLPELAKMFAKGMVYFKRNTNEFKNYFDQEINNIAGKEIEQFKDFTNKIDGKLNQIRTKQLPSLINEAEENIKQAVNVTPKKPKKPTAVDNTTNKYKKTTATANSLKKSKKSISTANQTNKSNINAKKSAIKKPKKIIKKTSKVINKK